MTFDAVTQRTEAKAFANEVRFAHATWKRETHLPPTSHGLIRAADLLCDGDAGLLDRIRLDDALGAVHGFPRQRWLRLLSQAGIYRENKRVGELTWRQRYALATLLRVEANK
jgi:hypothetical protein